MKSVFRLLVIILGLNLLPIGFAQAASYNDAKIYVDITPANTEVVIFATNTYPGGTGSTLYTNSTAFKKKSVSGNTQRWEPFLIMRVQSGSAKQVQFNTFNVDVHEKTADGPILYSTQVTLSSDNQYQTTVSYTKPTTTAGLGKLSGKLTYIDPRDKQEKKFGKTCDVTLFKNNKAVRTVHDICNPSDGSYAFTQQDIPAGTYVFKAVYRVPSETNNNLIPFDNPTGSDNVVIKAGPNSHNLKVANVTGLATPTPTPVASADDKSSPCDQASGPYAWLLCPAVTKVDEFLKNVYTDVIEDFLRVDPLNTKSTNGTYQVWKAFVSLANVLFVLAFLGIIFGTVMNLDAYTVKKALPRLVIAAVAVQISYFVCGILIDISNIFGTGILDFITNAIKLPPLPGASGSSGVETALSYGAVALIGLFATAVFLGPVIAFMLLGFAISVITFIVTLLIRKLLITVLIILAPIAFVAWILPNTESLFNKWRDNFIKLLFIYPIMSLLIGAAYVVQAASKGQDAVSQIAGGVAPMIAFFMMPAVFKMSGKAMGLTGGAIGKLGSRGNAKIQGSQVKKDAITSSKGKAAQKYLSSNTGPLGKGVSMLRGGAVLPTAASKRRLSTTANTFAKSQGDEFENQINRAKGGVGFNSEDFSELLGAETGTTTGTGIKATAESKQRAIEMMAKKGMWDEIRSARSSGHISEATLKQGLSGSDAFTKARDLALPLDANGQVKSPEIESAAAFIGMHKSTQVDALKHMATQLGSSDAAEVAKGQASRAAVLTALEKSPDSIDKNIAQLLNSGSTVMKRAGVEGPIDSGLSPTEQAIFAARFNSDGTIKKAPQEVRVVP